MFRKRGGQSVFVGLGAGEWIPSLEFTIQFEPIRFLKPVLTMAAHGYRMVETLVLRESSRQDSQGQGNQSLSMREAISKNGPARHPAQRSMDRLDRLEYKRIRAWPRFAGAWNWLEGR
uniref:Uncharacterized protein n=1 Tax=Candidatus Kentrum sp. LFY TaxID=2126342 RepID=A0A450X3X9_9GAMM|nr:MAG: hypothetical protein BECKLFY1418C_GA0070996_11633 [Candidatus Kentron sp. LFY]